MDDVSFEIYPGETYGLVGESGSGKSTIGRSIIRLYDPTAGKDHLRRAGHQRAPLPHPEQHPATQMQMIFQDPMASLNPRKKVEDIIGEGLDIHHMYKTQGERREKVEKILAKVGLAPEHAERYPPPVLRRPAPARRHCPRPHHEPEAHHRRRVHLGAGRVHSGTGGQPDEGHPAGDRHGLPVHCPRPVHGQSTSRTASACSIWGTCWRPAPPRRSSSIPSTPHPESAVGHPSAEPGGGKAPRGRDLRLCHLRHRLHQVGTSHHVEGSHYVKCTDDEFAQWCK